MESNKKHNNNEDQMVIQQYLDELSKIKLIDRGTLLKLHQNISLNHYSELKIINSISDHILNDTTVN